MVTKSAAVNQALSMLSLTFSGVLLAAWLLYLMSACSAKSCIQMSSSTPDPYVWGASQPAAKLAGDERLADLGGQPQAVCG